MYLVCTFWFLYADSSSAGRQRVPTSLPARASVFRDALGVFGATPAPGLRRRQAETQNALAPLYSVWIFIKSQRVQARCSIKVPESG